MTPVSKTRQSLISYDRKPAFDGAGFGEARLVGFLFELFIGNR